MTKSMLAPATKSGSLLTRAAGVAFLSLVGSLAAGNGAAAPAECPPDKQPGHPDCGIHNMMLVGNSTIYASHLPMFNSRHRFQIIVEIGFSKDGKDRSAVYAADREANPKVGMYTLHPLEEFVVARLFDGDDKRRRTSFHSTVFRGHQERGGLSIEQLVEVDAAVKKVVYAQEIGPPAGPGKADELTYIVFGRGDDMFLAHRLDQPPDFDQLLRVRISGHDFTEEELIRGVLVTALDRPNDPARRLKTGETVKLQAHVTGAHKFVPVEAKVLAEPYFEQGELATKATFLPTPLEIKAGFSP